jgi:hypothetical protein
MNMNLKIIINITDPRQLIKTAPGLMYFFFWPGCPHPIAHSEKVINYGGMFKHMSSETSKSMTGNLEF